MCVLKNQIMTGYVIVEHVYVAILTNYTVDLTIP